MRAATIPSPIEIPSRLFPRRTKLVRLVSPQSPNSVFTAYRVIPRHYCGCLSSLTGKYEFSLHWNPTHTDTHTIFASLITITRRPNGTRSHVRADQTLSFFLQRRPKSLEPSPPLAQDEEKNFREPSNGLTVRYPGINVPSTRFIKKLSSWQPLFNSQLSNEIQRSVTS